MMKLLNKIANGVGSIIIGILIFIVIIAMSWGITIGLIALICLCFGWQFNLLIATGVWLVIILLRSIISAAKSDSK